MTLKAEVATRIIVCGVLIWAYVGSGGQARTIARLAWSERLRSNEEARRSDHLGGMMWALAVIGGEQMAALLLESRR